MAPCKRSVRRSGLALATVALQAIHAHGSAIHAGRSGVVSRFLYPNQAQEAAEKAQIGAWESDAKAREQAQDAAGDAEYKAWVEAKAKARAQEAAEAKARAKEEVEAAAVEKRAQDSAAMVAKAEAEAKGKADAKAKAKSDAEVKAKAEAQAEAEAEAKAKSDAEAKARSEAEAKAKAEAIAEANEEAKSRAEAEAKAKAEAQAVAKVEAEAKAENDAQAKVTAEAAAKASVKAEEMAKAVRAALERSKAKALSEATAKADARAKAEAEVFAKDEVKAAVAARAEVEEDPRKPLKQAEDDIMEAKDDVRENAIAKLLDHNRAEAKAEAEAEKKQMEAKKKAQADAAAVDALSQANVGLHNKVEELTHRVSDLSNDKQQLLVSMEKLLHQNRTDELLKEIGRLQEVKSAVEERNARERAQLELSLHNEKSSLAEAQGEVTELKHDGEVVLNESNVLRAELAPLQQQARELADDKKHLVATLHEVMRDGNQLKESLEKEKHEADSMKRELAHAKIASEAYGKSAAEAEKRARDSEGLLAANRKNVMTEHEELEALREKDSKLEMDKGGLLSTIHDLRRENTELKQVVSTENTDTQQQEDVGIEALNKDTTKGHTESGVMQKDSDWGLDQKWSHEELPAYDLTPGMLGDLSKLSVGIAKAEGDIEVRKAAAASDAEPQVLVQLHARNRRAL